MSEENVLSLREYLEKSEGLKKSKMNQILMILQKYATNGKSIKGSVLRDFYPSFRHCIWLLRDEGHVIRTDRLGISDSKYTYLGYSEKQKIERSKSFKEKVMEDVHEKLGNETAQILDDILNNHNATIKGK